MALTHLLPLLASLQMLPRPVSPADPPAAPTLSLSPQHQLYLTGESVVFTCSAPPGDHTVTGFQFSRVSGLTISPGNSDTHTLSNITQGDTGSYTCAYWVEPSGRRMKSAESPAVSISVTDPLPAPTLRLDLGYTVSLPGERVTLMCSAPRHQEAKGYRFFYQGQQVSSAVQHPSEGAQLELTVEKGDAGSYTCAYWRRESSREISSWNSSSVSIPVTDPDPAPQLTVSPEQPVYITWETVTLTCSATRTSTMSGVRFLRDDQKIPSQEQRSPRYSYSESIRLSGESGLRAGVYSCESWKRESGREIPSKRSRTISIEVTDPDPAPQLTVSPQPTVYITGETVTLTCSVPRASTMSGVRFFRDYQEIHSKEQRSPLYSYSVSIRQSRESGLRTGVYSCESWRTVSGREIPSKRSRTISITVTDPDPAPELTVSPQPPVYITGETVTLTCSVPKKSTESGVRFFRDDQKIHSKEQRSPGYRYSESFRLSGVSGLGAGVYSCESWKTVSGREIPSKRSRPISITVTELLPQPSLSMDPPSGAVSEGYPLLLTCTAPREAGQRRFLFYKDGAELVPGNVSSEISTTEPVTSSMNTSVLRIPRAGPNHTGEFTCRYEENMSGRWIPSNRSQTVNITVTASSYIRDLLLKSGGILLLTGLLAALIFYCYRKRRVPKPQKNTKGSEPGDRTRNQDPGCDNKGSKATGAGAEQMEQGSDVTYALVAFPASRANPAQKKKKTKPAEDEHVLYSEVVTTRPQRAAK